VPTRTNDAAWPGTFLIEISPVEGLEDSQNGADWTNRAFVVSLGGDA
jgi:hypothetical protein